MADGILGNLKDAWGVEDDGPDPSKLSGLLQLAEAWLEVEENDPSEVAHHFEAMKNNVVGAHVARSQALTSGGVKHDPQFMILVKKNLSDMESVEHALDMFIDASSEGERDTCWDSLGELEGAFEALKESGDAVEGFIKDSPLICMGCASIGDENICPKCGAERLKLDPNPPTDDERKTSVSDEVMEVYQAYEAVVTGKGAMTALVTNLQSLEFTYLEAEAIGQQTLTSEAATDHIKRMAKDMLAAIAATLSGIEIMHGASKSRASAELSTGWKKILEQSVTATDLIGKLEAEAAGLE